MPPSRIFQSVAAGLLGRDAAIAGGAPTAALGLALHFFIALTVAVVFFAAARFAPALWQRPWIFGSLYGIGVYGVMHLRRRAAFRRRRPHRLARHALGRPVDRRPRLRHRRARRARRSRRPAEQRAATSGAGRRRLSPGCPRLRVGACRYHGLLVPAPSARRAGIVCGACRSCRCTFAPVCLR